MLELQFIENKVKSNKLSNLLELEITEDVIQSTEFAPVYLSSDSESLIGVVGQLNDLKAQVDTLEDITVKSYLHHQVSAQSTWTINHNFGKSPHVTILNSAGDRIYADISDININTIQITFTRPTNGEAILGA